VSKIEGGAISGQHIQNGIKSRGARRARAPLTLGVIILSNAYQSAAFQVPEIPYVFRITPPMCWNQRETRPRSTSGKTMVHGVTRDDVVQLFGDLATLIQPRPVARPVSSQQAHHNSSAAENGLMFSPCHCWMAWVRCRNGRQDK